MSDGFLCLRCPWQRSLATNLETVLPLARADFACYCRLLYPGYQLARHHLLLIDKLEAVERIEIARLMGFMPPRHGKTLTAAQLFPAWYLGRHPERGVIYASYSQEIADDSGRKVRNFLADPIHRAIFPDSILAADSTAQSRFHTTRGGSYFAVGRGGPITGRGGSLVIVDDALKDAEEAKSEVIRRTLKEWFSSVVYTRLAPGGAIVLIQTRWHQDDLAGWLLHEHKDQNWRVLSLPAISEEGDAFRKPGEALWPERYGLEELEAARRQLGSAAFISLYQQRPVAAEGQIFRRDWWCSYSTSPEFKRKVLSLDSAFKTGQSNDFSCIQVWGEAQNGFYLLANWKSRVEFPELKRVLLMFYEQWQPNHVLIEDAASGQSLIQELRVSTSLPLKPIKPDKDKVTRATAITPLLESGRVFLPQDAPWLNDFLDELSSFPAGVHDDQVDATAKALNYMRGKPTHGFVQFCDAVIAAGGVDQYFAQRERERSDREVTAINPKTGQRLKLDRVNNRWIDCVTGVPI